MNPRQRNLLFMLALGRWLAVALVGPGGSGAGLHNAPGYAARMFGALSGAGVNIEMISTSEVRITCTIAEHDLEAAVRALHAAFELATADPVDGPVATSPAAGTNPTAGPNPGPAAST